MLGLQLVVVVVEEGQRGEIGDRAQRQHLPGIAQQQGDEDHRGKDHRHGDAARNALAERLAGIGRQARYHEQADGHDVAAYQYVEKQGFAQAEQYQIDRQQYHHGTGRRGHADEEILLEVGPVGRVELDVEAGKPEAGAHGIDQCRDPAEGTQFVEQGEIQHHGGRDAEIDEIGKAVHLGAEPCGRFQEARHAPVDAVQNGGEDDGAKR